MTLLLYNQVPGPICGCKWGLSVFLAITSMIQLGRRRLLCYLLGPKNCISAISTSAFGTASLQEVQPTPTFLQFFRQFLNACYGFSLKLISSVFIWFAVFIWAMVRRSSFLVPFLSLLALFFKYCILLNHAPPRICVELWIWLWIINYINYQL